MDDLGWSSAIIITAIGGIWTFIVFLRDWRKDTLDRSRQVVDRLLESDILLVNNPDIPMYLADTAGHAPSFFRSDAVMKDKTFFKAKAYAYMQLNLFDELMSSTMDAESIWLPLRPPVVIEFSAWEEFICRKLSHPLFCDILDNESKIFGDAFIGFWQKKRSDILAEKADPLVW